MTAIRTVLGDVVAAALGPTYLHEHLIIDHPLVADRFPHIFLPSVDEAAAEVSRCAAVGVKAMVDAMPAAAGRNVVKLARVSERTGVAIVAATGLHTAKYYPGSPWALEADPATLADLFVADITEGIDRFDYSGPVVERTPHRAGMIKVATTGERPTDVEARWLEAAAMAHARTGCPILTHCEEGRGAPGQVESLTAFGVAPDRVVVSHTDKVEDLAYHRDLLDTGVNVEYDQGLRQALREETFTIGLFDAMASEGHLDQLMAGTDGARRSLWAELGGEPGLAYLYDGVARHLDEATRIAVFVTNPARFLAF